MTKPTYQLHSLSGAVNFLPINIAAITSASTTPVHTSHATNYDELWLRAYNYTDTDAILYLCLGGTATHQIMPVPIPAGVGIIPVINGDVYTGSVELSAFASAANHIALSGRVNRIVFI